MILYNYIINNNKRLLQYIINVIQSNIGMVCDLSVINLYEQIIVTIIKQKGA